MPKKKSYVTVTDQFCGAGGSSLGAANAGAEITLALNHWDLAIETHNTNFPDTLHDCTDISACDPRRYPSTDVLITSPECTNHSLAKGRKRKMLYQQDLFGAPQIDPAEERSRATMWDVPRFAEFHDYNVIIVENVVDARLWVPFDNWLGAMHSFGYKHKIVYLNSMFCHPTPQSRDRMYVIFWKGGNPAPDLEFRPQAYCSICLADIESVQSWKNTSRQWGKYGPRNQYVYCCPRCGNEVTPYYYAAANAIDWSLPAPLIRDRIRPLKEKTLKRIEAGLKKFTIDPAFLVRMKGDVGSSAKSLGEAIPTLTSVGPFIVDLGHTHAKHNGKCHTVLNGLPTQTAQQRQALVMPPFIIQLRNHSTGKSLSDPLATVCAGGGHHGLIMPFVTSYYGTATDGKPVTEPLGTVTSRDRHGLVVPPFILSYYTRTSGHEAALTSLGDAAPTMPTWPVHYLVEPGQMPSVEDCGFRMLKSHEIGAAMAFPGSYQVLGTERQRVKQYGNAVTPPAMRMLFDRCLASLVGG